MTSVCRAVISRTSVWSRKWPQSVLVGRDAAASTELPGVTEWTWGWRFASTHSPGVFDDEELKPIIKIPVKLQEDAIRRKERRRLKLLKREGFEGDRGVPVIQCRLKHLNHYLRQTYPSYKKIPLASEHWMSRRTNGDYFTIRNYAGALYRDGKTVKAFDELGLDPLLLQNVRRCGFKKPTLIQSEAIPKVIAGDSCLISSETGNGKTLAFLLPALHQVLDWKLHGGDTNRPVNAPLVVIVSPGRELAAQIYCAAADLTDGLPITVRHEEGGQIRSKSSRGSRGELDILIGSFGILRKLFNLKVFSHSHVHHVIFDEADTLLDDTFNGESIPFLGHLSSAVSSTRLSGKAQLTFVGATRPTNLDPILSGVCSTDELVKVTTPSLHTVLPNIQQKFLRVPGQGKEKILLDLVAENVAKKLPTLIFSNRSCTAHFVSKYLTENNVPCATFHSAVPLNVRKENLDKFLLGEVFALSCTDLCSRGIDTFNAKRMINFEFPLNMSDYIHRLGRVGRVGSPQDCRVVHFVRGKLVVSLVQMIENAVRTNSEVPNVNNNIIRIIRRRQTRNAMNEIQSEEDFNM